MSWSTALLVLAAVGALVVIASVAYLGFKLVIEFFDAGRVKDSHRNL